MKATIVTMTSQLAKDYLSRNNQNREVKKNTLNFYKDLMSNGRWKENGEPIIIDNNGVIKDGQHRLMAVAETGYAYRVPVISGISPDVMDTIDTGTNRSAGDVLHLEGFKYATLTASIIKNVLIDTKGGNTFSGSSHNFKISNNAILEFARKYKSYLEEICKRTMSINSLQVVKVLPTSLIGFYLYTYGNKEEVVEFLKRITGTHRHPQSATDYVFKKLMMCKQGDARLSMSDKRQYIEKAFNLYVLGDKKIKSIHIKK